jgi:hypothetical protein
MARLREEDERVNISMDVTLRQTTDAVGAASENGKIVGDSDLTTHFSD